ncbi:TPA: endonuclease/exonuclease/phosphatase family protein [Kluyvera cryocrescens]|nr:endonuclease/exonuclease/phosphatase family protein [Kluyvera cryocrescens]
MSDLVSIAWWNTGLSPAAARDRVSEEDFNLAIMMIVKIMLQYDIDIFCLGEVSPQEIKKITFCAELLGYYVYDGTYSEGRIKHDLCAIVKTSKFSLLTAKSITEQTLIGPVRAGQELQLTHMDSGDSFYLYVSHWPSRSFDNSEGMPQRQQLGRTLKQAIERCKEERKGKYFILVGDYNDEPFDYSLTHALFATRDRSIVLKNSGFFYNPFWRYLGMAASLKTDVSDDEQCTYGTYYYKSGKITRWHTFDQIMFSSSFLKGGQWMLLEEKVSIVNGDDIRDLILSNETKFDHLPVVASIKRI